MRHTFGIKPRMAIGVEPALFREGLRTLLEARGQFLVVHDSGSAGELLERARALKPDVVLLDLALPGVPRDSSPPEEPPLSPPTVVVGLTASIDDATTAMAFKLRARGLVLKTSSAAVLVRAVRAVIAGEHWLDREPVPTLMEALLRRCAPSAPLESARGFRLTDRECEIVSAVAAACANKDIALRFAISETTVKHHLTSIFNKTGVTSRLELAMLALTGGSLAASVLPHAAAERLQPNGRRGVGVRATVAHPKGSSPTAHPRDLTRLCS